ncbi:MAG: histone deacetylase [Bacteroidota bacterium]
MSAPVAFLTHEAFLLHRTPPGHPERPARLEAVTARLRRSGLWEDLLHPRVAPAREEDLLAVHTEEHLALLRSTCASGGGMLDAGDTFAVRESFGAALRAAGAVIAGIEHVLEGRAASAFCAVRPPGHHAERERPMGFCLLNNVAVGASYARRRGISRVAVLDWDVHHGNGTQHIFEEDPDVFYVSMHQYPFYPGTGARAERGRGRGEGATLNIPLPPGCGEREYMEAVEAEVIPALGEFRPGLLLLSAGFDAHRSDPLAGMMLEDSSYGRMTEAVRDLAPVVSVLEGGYSLEALAGSVESHLRALAAEAPP